MTIYLYVKQHSKTGLKYFGRTESQTPLEYLGSGIHWKRHVKKYGKQYVNTLKLWEFDDQESCTEFALKFSKENNIVESTEWANLIPENGKRISANIQSQEEVNLKISNTLKRRYRNGEIISPNIGKHKSLSESHKQKIKNTWKEKVNRPDYVHHMTGATPWNKGIKCPEAWNKGLKTGPNSKESNEKRSKTLRKLYLDRPGNRKGCDPWNKGLKDLIPWNKGKKSSVIQCPHCSKVGGVSNMKRWHFDNCKYKRSTSSD